MKAIILAGGGGTRLWPLSREDFPKQFLNFGSDLSLLQKTAQRLLNAQFVDQIVIITNTHHLVLVKQQIQKIAGHEKIQIIVEPCRRNTAPAMGLAIKYLEDFCFCKDSDTVLVLPSDHLIEPESIFLHAIEQLQETASQNGIITLGIRPTKPETGYGYIQIGKKQNGSTFFAEKFVEKPNLPTAQKYLEDPRFFWNAGIFIFSIQTFWQQLQQYDPALFAKMNGSFNDVYKRFAEMPDQSIDYAIMEKSRETLVCPLAVSWSDVGCWDSVYDAMEKDENHNVKIGNVLDIDTKNSLIFAENRLISTIGLDDMLIVETKEALFISKKGESQRVKNLVKELVKKGQGFDWGTCQILDKGNHHIVKKIQLFAGFSFQWNTANTWLSLGKKPIVDGNLLINPFDETIEFILVEGISQE